MHQDKAPVPGALSLLQANRRDEGYAVGGR
jgi:hypothetical protein